LCYESRYKVTARDVTSVERRISIKEEEHNQSLNTARNSPQDDFIKHSCGVTASRGNGPEATLCLYLIERPECQREGTAALIPSIVNPNPFNLPACYTRELGIGKSTPSAKVFVKANDAGYHLY
jgi:hypothetical protein